MTSMNSETKHWFSSSSGRIEIQLTEDDASSVSHSGQCDKDVEYLSHVPYVKAQLDQIDPAVLRQELEEYGAWDAEELADHAQNIRRILWIAGGDISEELYRAKQ